MTRTDSKNNSCKYKIFMNARKNLNKAETNNLNDTAKVF